MEPGVEVHAMLQCGFLKVWRIGNVFDVRENPDLTVFDYIIIGALFEVQ